MGDTKTVPLKDCTSQRIVINVRPERATVSLRQIEGYEIDSRTVKNTALVWDRLGRTAGIVDKVAEEDNKLQTEKDRHWR